MDAFVMNVENYDLKFEMGTFKLLLKRKVKP